MGTSAGAAFAVSSPNPRQSSVAIARLEVITRYDRVFITNVFQAVLVALSPELEVRQQR
jgi:hypothetical protein